MEENENKIGNVVFTEIKGSPIIQSENSPFGESFYFQNFYSEKETIKFVKNVERLIRSSKEYKDYVESLRTNISALNIDNILSFITTLDAELEFHHYPFSLYDVVDIVLTDNFLNNKKVSSFSVAKKVMELHYKHLIGLVPLSKTNHELVHSGNLFLSKKQIFGNYEKFMKKYDKAVSADLKLKVEKMEKMSEKNTPSDAGGLF